MTESDLAFHDWAIEQREIDRHVARRGRQHAFLSVDAHRTALVVIDIVPFFAHESPYVRGIVPNVNALADGMRLAGGTVAWVVPAYQSPTSRDVEFFGAEVAESYARSGGEGSPAERLWSGLAVHDDDLVAEKTARSAFFPGSSALADLLSDRDIDTIVVTGTVANVCVEASVRDAATLDLRVIVVGDAVAAMRDRDLNATLHTVYRSYGDVRSTTEVLALLGA